MTVLDPAQQQRINELYAQRDAHGARISAMVAQQLGRCRKCTFTINPGELVISAPEYEDWIHADCPMVDEEELVIAARYNALLQKLDRIMTGQPVYVKSAGAKAPAMGLSKRSDDRIEIMFSHEQIRKWSTDMKDRTAFILAINLHELGHMFHSPAFDEQGAQRNGQAAAMMLMGLEDQRQEMLTTIQFPVAADYFRMMNARALKKNWEKDLDGASYMLYYGRRHLFHDVLNNAMRKAALDMYGKDDTLLIERLITEYQLLNLPADYPRAWDIAVQLVGIDRKWRQDQMPEFQDMRKDCMPKQGNPTMNKKDRSQLQQAMKKLLGEPKAGKGQESPDATSSLQSDKQAGDSKTNGEPEQKPADSGTPTESREADREPSSGNSPMAGEEEQADGDDMDDDAEGDEGEGDFLDENFGDGKPKDEGKPRNADTPGVGGKQAGSSGTGELSQPKDAKDALNQMEAQAERSIEADVNTKHEALKSVKVKVPMGGERKGSLNPNLTPAARQLASLFREVNQDLRPTVHRNLKRGRLDARRVSAAVAQNSPRMFKRKVADFSQDAAMAVHIMVDVSSSMIAQMQQAKDSAFALARGIELSGHLAKVSTYDSTAKLQKNWLDPMYREYQPHGGGGTAPYALLTRAREDFKRLATQENVHNHVAIVVTDGAWSSPPACQMAIDNLVHDGVHVILIGIGMIPSGYSSVQVLSTPDVNGLAAAMRDPLRKLAVEIARGVRKKVVV